jgi:hypothetical protein
MLKIAAHPLSRSLGSEQFHAMADDAEDAPPPTPSLEAAVRRARLEAVEQGVAVGNVREADLARLSLLEDAIRPVVEQAPREAHLFDLGKTFGDPPRLFIDMIAFVELAEDRRTYRFFQDTRYGRILIAESASVGVIVTAATNYVARRLVARERALAADWRSDAAQKAKAIAEPTPPARSEAMDTASPPKRARGGLLRLIGDAFNALFIGLGTLVLIALILGGAYWVWLRWLAAIWAAHFGAPGL